jgi:hypothetical protein
MRPASVLRSRSLAWLAAVTLMVINITVNELARQSCAELYPALSPHDTLF